jgi:hypothetical protein
MLRNYSQDKRSGTRRSLTVHNYGPNEYQTARASRVKSFCVRPNIFSGSSPNVVNNAERRTYSQLVCCRPICLRSFRQPKHPEKTERPKQTSRRFRIHSQPFERTKNLGKGLKDEDQDIVTYAEIKKKRKEQRRLRDKELKNIDPANIMEVKVKVHDDDDNAPLRGIPAGQKIKEAKAPLPKVEFEAI